MTLWQRGVCCAHGLTAPRWRQILPDRSCTAPSLFHFLFWMMTVVPLLTQSRLFVFEPKKNLLECARKILSVYSFLLPSSFCLPFSASSVLHPLSISLLLNHAFVTSATEEGRERSSGFSGFSSFSGFAEFSGTHAPSILRSQKGQRRSA